jgi:hypothetical protein
VGRITDIKVGEVPEWQLLTSRPYSQKREMEHLNRLWQDGVVTDAELKAARAMLKPHLTLPEQVEARKELRFGVLRWTPAEVAKGTKTFRGRTIRLEDAMRSSGITKVDLVAWVKDKYVEVSDIILWTKGGKPYAKVPDPIRSIQEDIAVMEQEERFMKLAKRMYSIAKVKGYVRDQEALLEVLNSHLGAIYVVLGDLELLQEFPSATKSKRRQQLDLMRDRMAKLFYDEFDGQMPSVDHLRTVLEKETKKALVKRGLYPLSKHYKATSS